MAYQIEDNWKPGFEFKKSGFLRISATQISADKDKACLDLISLKSRPSAKITDGYVPVRYLDFENFPLGIVREALILGINQGFLTRDDFEEEELAKQLLSEIISQSQRRIEKSHELWANQALIGYLKAFEKAKKIDDEIGIKFTELELIQAFDIDDKQHVEWFSWGIFLTNQDNSVREFRLLKYSKAGLSIPNEVKLGVVLRILADGVSHSESKWNIERDPVSKLNENLERVRIREIGCLDQSVALIVDTNPNEARHWFEEKTLNVVKERINGGLAHPSSNCRNCKANSFCPTLANKPGILGITSYAPWPKSYSPSKLNVYRKCPRQYFLIEELGLRTLSETTSQSQQRGLLVHQWLEKAHNRSKKCLESDLFINDKLGEISKELSWTTNELDITKEYLSQHIRNCSIDLNTKVVTEAEIVAFDTDSDITIGTRPDILYVRENTLFWREVKTTNNIKEIENDLFFDIYPQLPLAVKLVSSGCIPNDVLNKLGNFSKIEVELELIAPDNHKVISWDCNDAKVLNKAWSVLAEQVDHWASDTLFAPSSNPPCNWCKVKDFCEFSNQAQVTADIDGLQIDLKTGEIIEVTPAKNLKDEERVIKALGLSASIMESIQEDDEIPF